MSTQDKKTINAIYPLQAGKIHRIVANHSDKALTLGSNNAVVQTTYNGSATSQYFVFHGAGEGYYYIRHRDSNKFMEVDGNLNTSGTKIVLASYDHNSSHQLFKLVPSGEGSWNIYPKNSTRCLDIQWSSQSNNAPLMLWGLNGNPNQQFKLR
ncbi:MAG: RICIN domain-containing protein [Bacteroidota bacterium]